MYIIRCLDTKKIYILFVIKTKLNYFQTKNIDTNVQNQDKSKDNNNDRQLTYPFEPLAQETTNNRNYKFDYNYQ